MSSSSSRSSTPSPASNRPYGAAKRSRRANANYNTIGTKRMQTEAAGAPPLSETISAYTMDALHWKDDDLALRAAAANSRMPYDRLTKMEAEYFPQLLKNRWSTSMYLYCRNKILLIWYLDPIVELTALDAIKEIPEPFNSDRQLIANIHAFLQRYGYINYGVFSNFSRNIVPEKNRKIIVIGAGAAGLAAARQLQFFGFDVTVLEARRRVGGRVMTVFRDNHPAELGAQIVMGITGNPIVSLAKQMPVKFVRIAPRCPIYDQMGKLVDPVRDQVIQELFNKILSTSAYIAHSKNITELDGQKLSLGATIDTILNQQYLQVLKRRIAFFSKYLEIGNTLKEFNQKIVLYKRTIEKCLTVLNSELDVETARYEDVFINYDNIENKADLDRAYKLRSYRYALSLAIQGYDDAERQRAELERVLSNFVHMEPSQIHVNNEDLRILDFHLANLEYGIGSTLKTASLKEWDADDHYAFEGSHMFVEDGYGKIMEQLSEDLNVVNNCDVKSISYNGDEVTVKYYDVIEKVFQTRTASAIVCTASLGVLKHSIYTYPECVSTAGASSSASKVENEKTEEKEEEAAADNTEAYRNSRGAIEFIPALPRWKRRAIGNLGFGSLNKLVLYFDKIFWDESQTFGRLNEASSSRGELFMFFASSTSPTLTGLFAGETASIVDKAKNDFIVGRAMSILEGIFGQCCPKAPKHFFITAWHRDEFVRGCYSYVSTKSEAADYDVLAAPVADGCGVNRVFFAGEHTNRQYTATVHGAFLSGVRAAASIADQFIGRPVPARVDTGLMKNYTVTTGKKTVSGPQAEYRGRLPKLSSKADRRRKGGLIRRGAPTVVGSATTAGGSRLRGSGRSRAQLIRHRSAAAAAKLSASSNGKCAGSLKRHANSYSSGQKKNASALHPSASDEGNGNSVAHSAALARPSTSAQAYAGWRKR